MESESVADEIQSRAFEFARAECQRSFGIDALDDSTTKLISNDSGLFCPAYWDGILCWPPTLANTLAKTGCPTYVVGFDDPTSLATRQCTKEGTWYFHPKLLKSWTNYSECFEGNQATIFVELPKEVVNISDSLLLEYMPLLKTIPRVGYTVSLCTLLVAFAIMIMIKRLHCPRNNLHTNLFASFILRAFILLLKDLIFVRGVGFSSEIKYKNGKVFFYEDTQSNNWSCKLFTTLCEFFITANYSWILMEGLYLHNLIFRALFTDSNSKITAYVILGWGLPVLVIVSWVITRLLVEDTYCWTTHDDIRNTLLVIRIPTTISIIINMILFIRIITVLFSKLRSTQNEEAKRYRKWAKSTLVLMPLFGVHYALFLGMSYSMKKNESVELAWLICDQLFASFQGFFVAMLYCFLNGEVRKELKPRWKSFCQFVRHGNYGWLCCRGDSEDFSTVKSRSSVCTMMSSTSLYNNGAGHRHRSHWDCFHHSKHHSYFDKRGHVCKPVAIRSWHDISPRKAAKLAQREGSRHYEKQISYSNGNIPVQDTGVYLNHCPMAEQERSVSEPQLEIEMASMLENETR